MGRLPKVKAADIARAAGVSRAAISKNKRLKRNPDGTINARASIRAMEATENSRARKEAALAGLRELELAQKSGQVIDIDEAAAAWANAGKCLRDAFISMPNRVAPELAALTDARQIREVLRDHVRRILTNLPEQIHNLEGRAKQEQQTGEPKNRQRKDTQR